jgi:hypothetical protein
MIDLQKRLRQLYLEQKLARDLLRKTWNESDHPRGQPENAGEFVSGASASAPKLPDHPKGPTGILKPTKTKTAPEQKPRSEKAERAAASAHRIDSKVQRYAEEHNEPRFAKAVGGVSFPDSEAVDIAIPGEAGAVAHGVELKTMVSNKANKITMKRSAMDRKLAWEKKNKAVFHTVVLDDQAVFEANGPGQHDESKRRIFYRRGCGSFRVGSMHEVKDLAELKELMNTPNRKLPAGARRTDGGTK